MSIVLVCFTKNSMVSIKADINPVVRQHEENQLCLSLVFYSTFPHQYHY